MKKIYYLLIIINFITSCKNNHGYKTAPSGLRYKFIIENIDAPKPAQNNIVTVILKCWSENDSLLINSYEDPRPMKLQVTPPTHEGGSIEDALAMMHIGDSAIFLIDAQNFFEKTRKQSLPPNIKKGSSLKFEIKLISIQTYEEFEKERLSIQYANEEEEKRLLKEYLQKANITVSPSQSGLYYIELQKGKGKKAENGNNVVVHYTGKFIDGKIFDSSLKRNEPFAFTVNAHQVIAGLEEGITNMREGGKAMLIIPSSLAYGSKSYGPIPPYSTLIFEIELLEVK